MGFAPTAVVEQGNEGIQQFMVGRDTRWYKGNLLKLNILVVSFRHIAESGGDAH